MSKKVVILDMQPIDPPVGGGRIRLLGLYSGFKASLEATYIGSYDWRGPTKRELQISSNLIEIDIPLSEKHFSENDKINQLLPGKTIIDVSFPLLAHHSKELIDKAREYASEADIVIFSHPWLFWSVSPVLNDKKQLIVYDSHNCEGLLRTKLLDDINGFGRKLARAVVKVEYECSHAADLILACSLEDKNSFVELYGIDPSKILIVPNGVFTSKIKPATDTERTTAKASLNLKGLVAIFVGSDYPPNVEAGKLIVEMAKRQPQVTFVIMGGVGSKIKSTEAVPNLIITGFVDEDDKLKYLAASDIALNPMLSGSGTNIKMFDYMAAALPVISTPIGARGIPNYSNNYYICEQEGLDSILLKLANDKELRKEIGLNGRKLVDEKFSWENISYELSIQLERRSDIKINQHKPYFSIIVPSYERHDLLTNLVERIRDQTEKDFELIIIDQSATAWQDRAQFKDLNIIYHHTTVRGAVKARNTGIRLAIGEVVAFIDDDCQPDINWLNNAKKYFNNKHVAGVEGMVTSSKINDPNYRTVTNVGFEGFGFMTANLFVRRDILDKIGGFDEQFDNPHFREDTDLGWRVLQLGEVPYAEDVQVYHPPHKREIKRESEDERAKFFVHDPLLLKKHPDKYIELFLAEGHYKKTKLFWKYFLKGIERHGVSNNLITKLLNNRRVEKKLIPKMLSKLLNS